MEALSIKSDVDDFNTLLDRLSNGEILIPTFQREFIWDTSMIKDLFDSILRGYPVGSLIFWRPSDEKFKVVDNIGGVRTRNHTENGLYVLDGRQRLTALMSVLHPDGNNFNKYFFNVKESTVEYSSRSLTGSKYISIGNLFNPFGIIDYLDGLRESRLSKEQQKEYGDRVKRYNRILMTYRIGYIIIKGGTIKEAVEVFSRLNSSGVSISPDYMLQALAYDSKTDFRLATRITEIIDGLDRYNFSAIKRDIVFNCLYNYIGIPFIDGKISKLLDHGEELDTFCNQLETDLQKAVNFLYYRCRVIDYKLMPYSYQIVMIADFFRLNPTPSSDDLEELRKWFFYTSYTGYFTSHSLTEIRGDIDRLRKFALGKEESLLEYSPIDKLDFPERLHLNSVRVKSYVINALMEQDVDENSELVIKPVNPARGKVVENCVIATTKKDALTRVEREKNRMANIPPQVLIDFLKEREQKRLRTVLGTDLVPYNL